MLRATMKGVVARRFRLALTGLAVLLGVSFVSTTYVLTDTLDRSFRGIFSQTLVPVSTRSSSSARSRATTTTSASATNGERFEVTTAAQVARRDR